MNSANRRHESADASAEALTSIRAAYTLAATNETEEPELDTLMVKHFIQTLAEISVSVASRRLSRQEPNR